MDLRSACVVALTLIGTSCARAHPPPPAIPPPAVDAAPVALGSDDFDFDMAADELDAMPQAPPETARGTLLWDMSWVQAEQVLTPDAVVVLPLGAASKEHGPHLLLKNDWLLAEYYKDRVWKAADVVIAPTLGFHYYPAFVEYPGSTSLSKTTSVELVVEVVRGLAYFGPRRFYVLNTGVSTLGPLQTAAERLAADGILLRYTNILEIAAPVEEKLREQPGGTHADEIETSMMLYIAPETVDMSKAVRDWAPKTKPGFSRTPDGPGHHSATGIWGDPTLATREKGEQIVEAMVAGMLSDIETLRTAELPKPAKGHRVTPPAGSH